MRAHLQPSLGAIVGLACGAACTADETPPELVEVSFVDGETLRLRFSEPIGPTGEIVPATHFRLGSAFYVERLGYTYYFDLAYHFPEGVPGGGEGEEEGAGHGDAWTRHDFTRVARIDPGAREDELLLTLSFPLEPYVCEVLEQAPALGIPGAIQLHYDEGSSPRVVDLAGNPLAGIGDWWVTETFSTRLAGAFPELDSSMPIPCPE